MNYDGIVGSAKSHTWTAHVMFPNGKPYQQTWTEQAAIPAPFQFIGMEPTVVESWRSPQLDKSSFRSIKKSGKIKMTDYDRGTVVTENNVVSIPRETYYYNFHGAYTVKDNKLYQTDTHIFDVTSAYKMQGDLRSFVSQGFPLIRVDDFIGAIEDEKQKAMASVVSALNSTYDALTDASEMKETLNMIKSILDSVHHPLSSFRDLRSKILNRKGQWNKRSAKQAYKQVADLWMEYRYGIMPLVYSMHDVVKLLEKNKAIYRTERAKGVLELSEFNPSVPGATCLVEQIAGQVTIRATGKAMQSYNGTLRAIDQISINPFKTAWELIPYSFVVDWFVNVGDYIDAHLGSLVSFASQREHCLAISSNYVRSTYFRDYLDSRCILTAGPWDLPYGHAFDRVSVSRGQLEDALYLLQRKTVNTYERRLFSSSDVDLRWNPYLNWKRFIDGFVLGFAKTRSSLRRLK